MFHVEHELPGIVTLNGRSPRSALLVGLVK